MSEKIESDVNVKDRFVVDLTEFDLIKMENFSIRSFAEDYCKKVGIPIDDAVIKTQSFSDGSIRMILRVMTVQERLELKIGLTQSA